MFEHLLVASKFFECENLWGFFMNRTLNSSRVVSSQLVEVLTLRDNHFSRMQFGAKLQIPDPTKKKEKKKKKRKKEMNYFPRNLGEVANFTPKKQTSVGIYARKQTHRFRGGGKVMSLIYSLFRNSGYIQIFQLIYFRSWLTLAEKQFPLVTTSNRFQSRIRNKINFLFSFKFLPYVQFFMVESSICWATAPNFLSMHMLEKSKYLSS